MRAWVAIVVAACVWLGQLNVAWAQPAVFETPGPDDPRIVVEAFELARGAGNLDAAVALFSDTAILSIQTPTWQTYIGRAQVRTYMEGLGIHFHTVTRSNPVVQGSAVSWMEHDELQQVSWDAAVVAVVRSGRITALVYRQSAQAPDGTRSAAQALQLPNAVWPALLGLIGAFLLGMVSRRPPRRSSSVLDGRLLVELRRQRSSSNRTRRAA